MVLPTKTNNILTAKVLNYLGATTWRVAAYKTVGIYSEYYYEICLVSVLPYSSHQVTNL